MEPIKAPKTLTVFQLLKQTGMNFSYAGSAGSISLGLGFYFTLQEAEHNRTLEVLRDTTNPKPRYHVFELEVPNPAYEE